jgi:hypothetical protein
MMAVSVNELQSKWKLTIAAGPRYTDFVTQWSSAFTAAASFDKELILERAKRIGQEFRGKGINVALAPVGSHSRRGVS